MAGTSEKLTYSDPSLQILQFLQVIGGTKTSTSTGASPAAISGLEQVLNQQMQGITPEGAQALIQSIFQEGSKAVPGIQTAYGQAAGARVSNNSPAMLQLGNLQAELAAKAQQALAANQAAAGTTANQLAGATRSTMQKQGTANKSLMLLPFLLGQFDKLGGMKKLGDFAKGIFGDSPARGGAANIFGDQPQPTLGFQPGIDFTGSGAQAGAEAVTSFGEPISRSFGGDAGTSAAFDLSGVGDFSFDNSLPTLEALSGGSIADAAAGDFFSDFSFADGGLVSKKRMGTPAKKAKGYADGGSVSGVDTRYTDTARSSSAPIRGINVAGAQQGTPQRSAPGTNSLTRNPVAVHDIALRTIEDAATDAGSSGIGVGTTSGPVGTPGQNAAALGGLAASAIGLATGIPAGLIGLGLSSLGVPNSSMSAPAQLAAFVASLLGITGPSDAEGIANGDVAAPGVVGMSTPGVTGSLGMSTTAALSGLADTTASVNDGLGVSADGVGSAGIGGGIGGTGNSAGDASAGEGGTGVGNGDGTAGGTASAANGGKIKGPGSGTSDSININVSDGEYIMPKDTVDFFGVDMLDFMRQISHTPVAMKGAR